MVRVQVRKAFRHLCGETVVLWREDRPLMRYDMGPEFADLYRKAMDDPNQRAGLRKWNLAGTHETLYSAESLLTEYSLDLEKKA